MPLKIPGYFPHLFAILPLFQSIARHASNNPLQRRRTQIRLAQRAYRLRKENTINQLKEHVTSLQETIEEMSKAFLAFNDNAMNSGILQVRPELARQLKATTERFINLTKTASKSSDDEHEGSDADSHDESQISRQPQQNFRKSNVSNELRSSSPEDVPRQQEVLPLGYVQIMDDSSDALTPGMPDAAMLDLSMPSMTNDLLPTTNGNYGIDSLLQAAGVPYDKLQPRDFNSQVFSVESLELPSAADPTNLSDLRNLSVNQEIPPAYTYSFQETRFAKRLHRATLERGFHLLSTAHLRPAAFSHVFRLSLLYNTRDALLARFKYKLSLPPDAPLEYYNTPFIHLGGAGLHYSKRKIANSFVIKPGPMMPGMRQAKALLESAEKAGEGYEIELDLREYEGEWYDANDVEGFLEEKGVKIERMGSFAEAQIVDYGTLRNGGVAARSPASNSNNPFSPPSLSDASGTNMAGSPKTPLLSETSLELGTSRLFPELDALNQQNTSLDSSAMGWLMGSGDKTPDFLSSGWADDNHMFAAWGANTNAADPFGEWSAEAPETTGAGVPKKRTVTIDVNKFINGESLSALSAVGVGLMSV